MVLTCFDTLAKQKEVLDNLIYQNTSHIKDEELEMLYALSAWLCELTENKITLLKEQKDEW